MTATAHRHILHPRTTWSIHLLGARQAGKIRAPKMPLGPHEGLGPVPSELLQPRLCCGWAVLPISHTCVLKSKLRACVKMHSRANKAC